MILFIRSIDKLTTKPLIIMKTLILAILMLFTGAASAQLVGRKNHKLYLYQYNPKTKDGSLLFEIDTRMIDVIESITINNRKRFGRKSITVRISEDHYYYADQSGFIVRADLCSLREIVGRFSDTATVDIKIKLIGGGIGWEKAVLLDKSKLRKTQYIGFR
jgi:hypothetical protein